MSPFRTFLLVALALPFLAPICLAWGPYTHVALGEEVLAQISLRPGSALSFLLQEPERSTFLAASMGPDMTFSLTGLGKGDRRLDRQLHSPALCDDLRSRALSGGAANRVAFALGWLAHVVADREMCRAGGVVYTDLFGLSPAARRRLGGDVPGITKVLIDAILLQELPELDEIEPAIDVPFLAPSVGVLRGATSESDLEDSLSELSGHARTFAAAVRGLGDVCRKLAENRRAFPELVSLLTVVRNGEFTEVNGIRESAEQVLGELQRVMPASFQVHLSTTAAAPLAGPSVSLLDRISAGLNRRGRVVLADEGPVARWTRRVILKGLDLVNSLGLGGELTRRARIKATFLAEMVADRRSWPQIRDRIRELAELNPLAAAPPANDSHSALPHQGPP